MNEGIYAPELVCLADKVILVKNTFPVLIVAVEFCKSIWPVILIFKMMVTLHCTWKSVCEELSLSMTSYNYSVVNQMRMQTNISNQRSNNARRLLQTGEPDAVELTL